MKNELVRRRDDFFAPFEQTFDSFFDSFFNSSPFSQIKSNSSFPKMNIVEHAGEFAISLSVSGMTSDDVSVEVDDKNVLKINGKMSAEHRSPENATYFLRELRQSSFERQVQLPDYVQGDPVAVMKDGLLKLSWSINVSQKPEAIRKIVVKQE